MSKMRAQIIVVPGQEGYDWLQLAADATARLKRIMGWQVDFYIEANEFSQVFKIGANGDFKRESPAATQLISRLQKTGDIYKQTVPCPVCPTCGHPDIGSRCSICQSELVKEKRDGYFFRIQRHSRNLDGMAEAIYPANYRGELLNKLQSHSTQDVLLAVMSKNIIPAPWFGQLSWILARAAYSGEDGAFFRIWPETYIFVPRNQVSLLFNWMGVLGALNIAAPKALVCHSQLQIKDKSDKVVSSVLLAKNYGPESIRYFTLGEKIVPGESSFTEDYVIRKVNLDLANELGNLVSRVISLVERYNQGLVPKPDILTRQTGDLELRESCLDVASRLKKHIESHQLYLAIRDIKSIVGQTNRFIESTTPWQLAQHSSNQSRLNTVLYNLCEVLRFLAVCLQPLMPETADVIQQRLGIDKQAKLVAWESVRSWGLLPADTKVSSGSPLFPRIVPSYGGIGPQPDLVTREELARVNLVVARVISAEVVEDYDGLLLLILYDGQRRRRVLAPIAHSYQADTLAGRKVIMVSNLRSAEVGGLHNEGEVLVVEAKDKVQLVFAHEQVPEGSKVLCMS